MADKATCPHCGEHSTRVEIAMWDDNNAYCPNPSCGMYLYTEDGY